ncbi:hypothetical protein SO802_007865 [Lithocarpus litseifolius]|uniref:Uncharacterized protein n=1 Tax=Lithocarpus litseifolius TaxID=425828 RepID=A0AAW2DPV0_9ROSI
MVGVSLKSEEEALFSGHYKDRPKRRFNAAVIEPVEEAVEEEAMLTVSKEIEEKMLESMGEQSRKDHFMMIDELQSFEDEGEPKQKPNSEHCITLVHMRHVIWHSIATIRESSITSSSPSLDWPGVKHYKQLSIVGLAE